MSNRVKEIFQPDPMSGAMVRTYSLDYQIGRWKNGFDGYDRPGLTIARSADGLRQEVHWNSVMRPCEYKCYEEGTLLSWHKLIWEKDHTEGTGNLKTRVLYAPDGRALRCKVFDYDDRFNVVKETLHGQLSGYAGPMHLDQDNRSMAESPTPITTPILPMARISSSKKERTMEKSSGTTIYQVLPFPQPS